MDISALSNVMAYTNTKMNAAYKVTNIVMNVAEQNAEAVIEMINSDKVIEKSVNPDLGNFIDIKL